MNAYQFLFTDDGPYRCILLKCTLLTILDGTVKTFHISLKGAFTT